MDLRFYSVEKFRAFSPSSLPNLKIINLYPLNTQRNIFETFTYEIFPRSEKIKWKEELNLKERKNLYFIRVEKKIPLEERKRKGKYKTITIKLPSETIHTPSSVLSGSEHPAPRNSHPPWMAINFHGIDNAGEIQLPVRGSSVWQRKKEGGEGREKRKERN